MDRRTLLAIVLMLIVLIAPALLWPPARRPPPAGGPDSAAAADTTAPDTGAPPPPAPPVLPPAAAATPADTAPEPLVEVESSLYRLTFSARGARLVGATFKRYRSFAPGDATPTGDRLPAQIMPAESRFLQYAIVFGSDTLHLADWRFVPAATRIVVPDGGEATLEWAASRGPLTLRLSYRFAADRYQFDVSGRLEGVESGGLVLVHLGPRLALVEADSASDYRAYAVVTKAGKTESVGFGSLDVGERRELAGPFEWVAVKSRYFVVAVFATGEGQPRFGGAVATGGDRTGKHATHTDVVTSLPAPTGAFAFSAYAGPQEFRRLARVGHDFEDVNPYGWIFRPIIRPFANLIVVILLWMHETLSLDYGWVLILFGITVRILLWPLNQKAMRSSMEMQAIQPEVKALQDRYKQEPQRLQQEVMKLYRERGVNPVGGCLPLLLPMPILFALFFVFRETIEFRGVPFLWLPDLSQADPLFIIPIVMGLSMFAVSKIGQRGVPPNPQAKMLTYVMPVMLTVIFLQLSAGLNLYYAVSNIASVPQQWLISQERMRRLGRAT